MSPFAPSPPHPILQDLIIYLLLHLPFFLYIENIPIKKAFVSPYGIAAARPLRLFCFDYRSRCYAARASQKKKQLETIPNTTDSSILIISVYILLHLFPLVSYIHTNRSYIHTPSFNWRLFRWGMCFAALRLWMREDTELLLESRLFSHRRDTDPFLFFLNKEVYNRKPDYIL